jgi:Transglycosylase-like domain
LTSSLRVPSYTKLLVPLLLAAATLATLALCAAPADAATSGGISPGGDESEKQSTASDAKYERLWDRVKKSNKRWARNTAECESGKDPDAIGGGGSFRGAFQFMKSTWRVAPKSPGGDPIKYPYKTQAVVAVALKQRDGAHHWPNCG